MENLENYLQRVRGKRGDSKRISRIVDENYEDPKSTIDYYCNKYQLNKEHFMNKYLDYYCSIYKRLKKDYGPQINEKRYKHIYQKEALFWTLKRIIESIE